MTILPPQDPRDGAVRAKLRPPANPMVMLVSPLGWGSVLYCATSIIGGGLALLAGILGIVVFPLVAWVTATVESVRLRFVGIRRLGPPARSTPNRICASAANCWRSAEWRGRSPRWATTFTPSGPRC